MLICAGSEENGTAHMPTTRCNIHKSSSLFVQMGLLCAGAHEHNTIVAFKMAEAWFAVLAIAFVDEVIPRVTLAQVDVVYQELDNFMVDGRCVDDSMTVATVGY